MGNIESCPSMFDEGALFSCHAECPTDFKYVQGQGIPPIEQCVHTTRNDRSFVLRSLPAPQRGQSLPRGYSEEAARVRVQATKIMKLVKEDEDAHRAMNQAQDSISSYRNSSREINAAYVMLDQEKRESDAIKDVTDSLKPMRPPTAPASDIEIERRGITTESQQQLLFIQIALTLAVLSLLSYLVMPVDYAHGVAFLLLSVGISFGFFLRR